ncbi:MAG: peptide chain release factor N(5)-glutamine methyltransferase [Mobilitalea sp.]
MSTYNKLLQTAREILKQQEIADADVDAWYLLAHVFNMKRTDLLLHGEEPASEEGSKRYIEFVRQRAGHIPLQHITGSQEFMGLEFDVTEDVLIPRQDTEVLVEEVLKICSGKKVLDMCTGSGCIIISLSKFTKLQKAMGVDLSEKALVIAKKNANKHKVEIDFLQSDLFDLVEESYDVIVSNPPYIPTGEIESLMPEVKLHEPLTALDGSSDGLLFYRKITSASRMHLDKGGFLFFEIGHNQGEEVKKILQEEGFTDVTIKKDLSGRDRVVFAKRS